MHVLTVRSNGQVTLPAALRKAAGIREGDLLAAEVQQGAIVLRPKVLIDREQAYFWTQRWQAGEREADRDIREGRVRKFRDGREMVEVISREVGHDPGVERRD